MLVSCSDKRPMVSSMVTVALCTAALDHCAEQTDAKKTDPLLEFKGSFLQLALLRLKGIWVGLSAALYQRLLPRRELVDDRRVSYVHGRGDRGREMSSSRQGRCRGKFVAPGKFFPPPCCRNVTNVNPNPNLNHIPNPNPNLNPTSNPNPKFNPILNLNPNP